MNIPKIQSFPKIFHIGENYIANLFKGEVEITEKIDGSQFDFGISKDGEIVCRSKGEDLTYKDIPKMFTKAIEQVHRMTPILQGMNQEIYFYCEYLQKNKHNTLNYGRVPKNNLYLFGVKVGMNFDGNFENMCKYADMLDIERPNLLFKGVVDDVKTIETMLDQDSVLGLEKAEGLVVKNYAEPSIVGGMIFPISSGKYVREEFKERHATDWKTGYTSKSKLQIIIDSVASEARWAKAVQHLTEAGQLEHSPRDIGKLINEIKQDLFLEEEQNLKEELFKCFKNELERRCTRNFPEWYKDKLLESALPQNNDNQEPEAILGNNEGDRTTDEG